jgi:serine/threonine/tyrosine-interacting protein
MEPIPLVQETAMSDKNDFQASRAEGYTHELPSAPRINIPAPNFSLWSAPNLDVGSVIPNPDPRLNVDFLNHVGVNYSAFLRQLPVHWDYGMRRDAQEVLPFLYLGPLTAAKNRDFLRRAGITMVLGVQPNSPLGTKLTVGAFRVADELGLAKSVIVASDHNDLISFLSQAADVINEHLASMHHQVQASATVSHEGKVLVFCETGNDKSAAIVAAYLMQTFSKIDCVMALQICSHRRFCCTFGDNLKHTLNTFWGMVLAKREVVEGSLLSALSLQDGAATHRDSGQRENRKRTRSYEDDEDETMDISKSADDAERFQGRNLIPFI